MSRKERLAVGYIFGKFIGYSSSDRCAISFELVIFLGASARLRKVNHLLRKCLSVIHKEQLGSHWTDFHEI
jgi:hypothetical protein